MTSRNRFRILVEDLATKAKATLPDSAGRIDAAVALVLAGDVTLQPDGTAMVGSATQPLTTYSVNGSCSCPDYPRAPSAWCKHRIARAIVLRTDRAMHDTLDAETSTIAQDASTPSTEIPTPEDDDPVWQALAPSRDARATLVHPTHDEKGGKAKNASMETSATPDANVSLVEGKNGVSVPPQYLVWIQGKPFCKFAGLLQMAHDQQLVELAESWTYNDDTLSLAHSVAIFEDGRRFEGSGDATPSNVTKKVAPHFRRVALTRAKSRALRDALNIDMVAVEERGEE
jgi:hypothetical protein